MLGPSHRFLRVMFYETKCLRGSHSQMALSDDLQKHAGICQNQLLPKYKFVCNPDTGDREGKSISSDSVHPKLTYSLFDFGIMSQPLSTPVAFEWTAFP